MENNSYLAALVADPAAHLTAAEPDLRRLALSGLDDTVRAPGVLARVLDLLGTDPEAEVRAAAAEALRAAGEGATAPLLAATEDPEARVAEAATAAHGEVGGRAAVGRLLTIAGEHPDRLVREAAVASLGAIGDAQALPALLELVAGGPPQVRRRAVAALTAFDGPEVEAAILAARDDRNPMVREAAEMVVGRAGPAGGCCG